MSETRQLSEQALIWRDEIGDFLYGCKEMAAMDQLAFTSSLLAEFGQHVPQLCQSQLKTLSVNVERYPTWRLKPTILPKITDRSALTQPLDESPFLELMDKHTELLTPPDFSLEKCFKGEPWHELWQDKLKIEHSDHIFTSKEEEPRLRAYGLRYIGPDGRLLSRAKYIASLLSNGDAVRGRDENTYIFPLVDVSAKSPDRAYKSPVELLSRLNFIVAPETRLGVQVMHLLAGNPLHEDVVEITNEVISELRPNGTHKDTVGVVGVTRSQPGRFFRLSWWSMLPMPDWQMSEGVSGLNMA